MLFLYIFGNAKIRELIAFLTKNNIQACAVVNKISDDGTTKKVIGEIGWDEISRNISTILDDPVSKHRSNKHQISDNRTLLNVKSALGKKRIFCVTNQKESFYATITPDDLLDYYETIINPFHLLREIETLIRVILEKLDHQLDEETPLGDAVKALLDEKIYGKIPYDYPKKELSRLLNEAVNERNLFFHHRVENTKTKDLKTLWKELKYIFEKLHK